MGWSVKQPSPTIGMTREEAIRLEHRVENNRRIFKGLFVTGLAFAAMSGVIGSVATNRIERDNARSINRHYLTTVDCQRTPPYVGRGEQVRIDVNDPGTNSLCTSKPETQSTLPGYACFFGVALGLWIAYRGKEWQRTLRRDIEDEMLIDNILEQTVIGSPYSTWRVTPSWFTKKERE